MANQASCEWWQVNCNIGEGLKNLADSAITDFVQSLYDGAVAFVAQVSTFWMDTPSPDVDNAAVASLRDDMSWYVAGFAILGFLIGLIKLVMSQDVKNSLIGLGTPIVNLILAATAYATGIGLLLTASDEFSKWIVERSTGGDVDLTQMLTAGTALIASPGTAFLLFILLLLGAVINLLFMYFRDVMFLILSAFIVVLAAASGSEQGRQAWRKANGWLIALLLYKPVAAGIYSLGFRMLVEGSAPEGEEATVPEAMHSTLIALLILLLAALALPALIKFIVPAAGVGAARVLRRRSAGRGCHARGRCRSSRGYRWRGCCCRWCRCGDGWRCRCRWWWQWCRCCCQWRFDRSRDSQRRHCSRWWRIDWRQCWRIREWVIWRWWFFCFGNH